VFEAAEEEVLDEPVEDILNRGGGGRYITSKHGSRVAERCICMYIYTPCQKNDNE